MRKQKEKFNTLVLDSVQGFALENVYVKESEESKILGRKWHYGKNLVHLVVRNNSAITPFELPPKMGETPEKLHRALFWDTESGILFALKSPWYEKMKTIGLWVLIGLELLFVFLIFSSL